MKSLLLYVIRLFAHASFGIPTDLSSFSSPPTPSIPHILSPTNIPPSHSLAYLILKTLHNNISSETLKDTSAHVVRSLCILQRRQIVKRKGTIKRMKIKRMKIQLLFRWLWMCFNYFPPSLQHLQSKICRWRPWLLWSTAYVPASVWTWNESRKSLYANSKLILIFYIYVDNSCV